VAAFDGKQLTGRDWIGILAGALALVVSFFSWRHLTGAQGVVEFLGTLGVKSWYTAWGSGVSGWLPVLMLIGAAALLLAPGFGIRVPGVPFAWLVLAFAALVMIIIRWATLPEPDAGLLQAHNFRPEDVDAGASIGLYLGLAAALISLLGAVLRVLVALKPVHDQYTPRTEPLG
jgi:hypothetical protein